jgi:hypothetical protein
MKTILAMAYLLTCSLVLNSQIQKDNILAIMVDGKEFKAQPQNLKFGHYRYITGNGTKPDQCLRIWMAAWDGGPVTQSGSYLLVNGDKPDTKENFKKGQDLGKYKGIAAIKYVLETKAPRMEYHVGYSMNNDEKISATVFGGLGRIVNKMEDKAVTSATGFDQDIDPEGNGYKKQKNTDKIELKNGIVRIKIKAD